MTQPTDFTPAIVAANDAATGQTVYLTACDAWTPDPAIAELLTDPDDFDWRLAFAGRLPGVRGEFLAPAQLGDNGLNTLIAA